MDLHSDKAVKRETLGDVNLSLLGIEGSADPEEHHQF